MTAMPRQRTDLIVNDLGDERVAFDPATNTAHKLSPLATAVLAAADGSSDMKSVAAQLNVSEVDVAVACDDLRLAGLLEVDNVDRTGLTRRRALQGGAAVGAVLVGTVIIPKAAAAVSAHGPGGPNPGDPGLGSFPISDSISPTGTLSPPFSAVVETSPGTFVAPSGTTTIAGSVGSFSGTYGPYAPGGGVPGFPLVGVTGPAGWTFGTVDAPANAVFYHPAPGHPAIIAFTNTAMGNATIEFSGTIQSADSADQSNGTTINFTQSAGVPAPTGTTSATDDGKFGHTASFDATYHNVPSGGVIYILLGDNGSYYYDSSVLDLTVTVS